MEETLYDLGLTNAESKIYLCLLEIGFTTVTNISEKTKIHRTNVYDAIKKLIDKGLVSFLKEDNITFYEASDPNILLQLLKEKEDNLKKIIPQLLMLRKLSENTSDIIRLKGVSPFIESVQELLNQEKEILIFGISEVAIKILGARIFPFHKSRLEKGIPLKQIYSNKLKSKIKIVYDDKTKTKFCEQDDFNVSSIICGDEILITEWAQEVMTLRIKSSAVTNHYKSQFDSLWEISKK